MKKPPPKHRIIPLTYPNFVAVGALAWAGLALVIRTRRWVQLALMHDAVRIYQGGSL
jgi:hypothetical protein